jgi:hypothetical protein
MNKRTASKRKAASTKTTANQKARINSEIILHLLSYASIILNKMVFCSEIREI